MTIEQIKNMLTAAHHRHPELDFWWRKGSQSGLTIFTVEYKSDRILIREGDSKITSANMLHRLEYGNA